MKRKRMSKKRSRRNFTKNAVRSHKKNSWTGGRGGIIL